MQTKNYNSQANTSQTARAWKPMKPKTYTEESKPQGLYPITDRASKRVRKINIQPWKDPTQVFPKPAKTSKDWNDLHTIKNGQQSNWAMRPTIPWNILTKREGGFTWRRSDFATEDESRDSQHRVSPNRNSMREFRVLTKELEC